MKVYVLLKLSGNTYAACLTKATQFELLEVSVKLDTYNYI